jgi:hypothetical protein
MQRLLATLLLSVIGLLPVAPVFAGTSVAAKLPACCRMHGKHKCGMRSQQSEPSLYSVCNRCPFSTPASSPAVNFPVFPPTRARFFVKAIFNRQVAPEQLARRLGPSFERSRQKRGPPSFLS